VQYVIKDVAGNTSTLNVEVKSSSAQLSAVNKPVGLLFHYNQPNTFANDKVKVIIASGNLYDDLDFKYSTLPKRPGAYSVTYVIHNRLTPLHDTFDLWIKPDSTIGKYAGKAVIVNTDGVCENSTYEDGFVKTKARTFGDYFIKVDTVPPFIIPVNITKGLARKITRGIFLKIGDRLSGVKNYMGKVDGKWILMEWDYKTRVLSYIFTKEMMYGKHTFDLTVTDKKDNTAYFTADFYK
jgi:hypothetical protein